MSGVSLEGRNRAVGGGTVSGLIFACAALALGACTTIQRVPLPEAEVSKAAVLNDTRSVDQIRIWGDQKAPVQEYLGTKPDAELRAEFPALYGRPHTYLALSGGGEDGAFGAGLLTGWTAKGTRPEFTIVTGVSTGALIAPFAFLGSAYDGRLTEIYTQYSLEDLVKKRSVFSILPAASAVDPKPMRELIARYISPAVVDQIAEQHRRGRQLWIGTTNLDAGRPVLWNIGAIASSSDPRRVGLIHDVLLASASIPGAFPPVLINVRADGRTYDELHVDGGTTNQVFLYPAGTDWKFVTQKLRVKGRPELYVIRNASLSPTYEPVKAELLPIAGRSISSLIRTQGIGDLYRIYFSAQRSGLDFNLAFIPPGNQAPPNTVFDQVHMRKMFQLGQQQASDGSAWHKSPPGF